MSYHKKNGVGAVEDPMIAWKPGSGVKKVASPVGPVSPLTLGPSSKLTATKTSGMSTTTKLIIGGAVAAGVAALLLFRKKR